MTLVLQTVELFSMNVQFNLNGITLKQSEAETILSTSEAPIINVDISKYLSKGSFSTKKLFDLSIEKERPELAALAAKLAIQSPKLQQQQPKRREFQKGIRKLHEVTASDSPAIECLDYLLTNQKLGSIGAAMILETVGKGTPITLKDIAIIQVNRAWNKGVSEESSIFKGFKDDGKSIMPVVAKAQKGLVTYHGSPIYNSLRDGLKYLVKNGMALAVAKTSWGSNDKELTGSQTLLRRTVYEVSLTEKGKELVQLWGDISKFVLSYWENRLS
jgi:hypothetical protein